VPGIHRFVWDLREPAPPAFEHEYTIAAIVHDTPRLPEGVLVPPGTYTIRLSANGVTRTQTLHVARDPRVTIPDADFERQYALATRVADAMRRTYDLAQRARSRNNARDATRYERLNGALASMLDVIEGADAAPTATTEATTAALLRDAASGAKAALDMRGKDEP
jgi:hypothetical protein